MTVQYSVFTIREKQIRFNFNHYMNHESITAITHCSWAQSAVHCVALFAKLKSEIWLISAHCSPFSSCDCLVRSDPLLLEARSALCSLYLEKQQSAFVAMAQGTDVRALALHIEYDETGQKLRLKRSWTRDHQTTLSVLVSWLQQPSNGLGQFRQVSFLLLLMT